MYTLKTIAKRSTALGMAASLLVATILPAASVFAQTALNPLTERSLLLSSSAPGYIDTDGSGYSTANPNPAAVGNPGTPATYAPAGSGPNGKKTGQTFTFRASSSASIEAFTFQYCTTAAGYCQAPGNNDGDARTPDPDRQANEDDDPGDGGWSNSTSDLNVTPGFTQASGTPGAGQFQISVGATPESMAPVDTGWAFEASNWEDNEFNHPDPNLANLTGKNNLITLRNTDGAQIDAGQYVKIEFKASESIYITNPGTGHFFVKINTYNNGEEDEQLPNVDSESGVNENIVDGGVTVANVMTDSIHITTKVLETMAFSVGTRNPDTVVGQHGTCDAINQVNNNRLQLGNPSAEYSLETGRAWDVHSYWRLSSNSSGGATVYYSGNTLANTVGDEIKAMTSRTASLPGTEQFGLGFVDPSVLTLGHNGVQETWDPAFYNPDYIDGEEEPEPEIPGLVQSDSRYKLPSSFPFITHAGQTLNVGEFLDMTAAQDVGTDYRGATGSLFEIDEGNNNAVSAGDAEFKFNPLSLTIPEPIASQNETVISCATAKMRYVGNIAADTPAGVYTTKVNYLAAPQY